MKNNDGSLGFKVDLDNDNFKQKLRETENSIRGLSNTAQKEGKTIEQSFAQFKRGIGSTALTAGLGLITREIIKVRGEFQSLEIAFSTMLGSKEKANKLMAEAVELAAKTPFTLQEVATGSKQLLAYGFAADDVVKQVKMLGDVAAGVSTDLAGLVYLYGTLKTSGRTTLVDLQQFAGRGVPIFEQLSKQLGVTTAEIRGLVTAGKIGFPEVEKAFTALTSSGGMFFNLMEQQSKTVTGQISNLQDAWSRMLNEIGQSNEGIISTGIGAAQSLVANYAEILKIIETLVVTYGMYKAAVITITAFEKARMAVMMEQVVAGKALSTWEAFHTVVVNKLKAAYIALNASNPYGWIAGGIALLTGLITYLAMSTTESQKAASKMSELAKASKDAADSKQSLADATSAYQTEIGVERTKLQTLFDQIRQTNKGSQERQKLIDKVNSTYGTTLTNLDNERKFLKELNAAYEDVTRSIQAKALANAQEGGMTKLYEEEIQARTIYNDAKAKLDLEAFQTWDNTQQAYTWKQRQNSKLGYAELIALIGDTKSAELNLNSTLASLQKRREQLLSFSPQTENIKKAAETVTQSTKTIGDELSSIDARINELKDKRLKIPTTDTESLNRVNSELEKLEAKKKSLEAGQASIAPMGSLSYWEQVKQKAEAALKLLTPDDGAMTDKAEGYINQIREAQRKIDEIQFNTMPFDEQLEYMKSQYLTYSKFVDNLGRETAEQHFSNLLTKGESYESYLLAEQSRLFSMLEAVDQKKRELLLIQNPTKTETGKLTTYQTQSETLQRQLVEVNIRLSQEGSPEAALDRFRQNIAKTTEHVENLNTRLNLLNSAREKLATDFTPIGLMQYDELSKRISEVTDQLVNQYLAVYAESKAFSERMAGIRNNTPVSSTNENPDTQNLTRELTERNQVYKSLLGDLSSFSLEQVNTLISSTERLINRPEFSSIKAEISTILNNARNGIANLGYVGYDQWSSQLKDVYERLSQLGPVAQEQAALLADAIKATAKVNSIEITAKYDIVPPDLKGIPTQVIPATVEPVAPVEVRAEFDITPPDLQAVIPANPLVIPVELQASGLEAGINEAYGIVSDLAARTAKPTDTARESTESQITDILQKYQDYTAKRLEIERQYMIEMNLLNSKMAGSVSESERQRLQAVIDERGKAYDRELQELEISNAEQIRSKRDFYETYLSLGRETLKEIIEQTKKDIEAIDTTTEAGMTAAEKLKQKLAEITDASFIGGLIDGFGLAANALGEMAQIAGEFNSELAESLNTAAQVAGSFSGMIEGFASGDYVKGASNMIQAGLKISEIVNKNTGEMPTLMRYATASATGGLLGILSLNKQIASERAKERAAIQAELIANVQMNQYYRERLLTQQNINRETMAGMYAEIGALMSARSQAQADYDETFKRLNDIIGGSYEDMLRRALAGDLSESELALFNIIQDLRKEIEGLNGDIETANDSLTEMFAGTDASGLANAMVSAFQEGKDAMEDWQSSFDDILQQAVYSILKAKLIMPLVEDFINKFLLPYTQVATNNGDPNSPYQISPKLIERMGKEAQAEWIRVNKEIQNYLGIIGDTMNLDLMGIGPNGQTMQGAIKGITEESASIIAGQFNAMRIIQFDMLAVARNSLLELFKIEVNTRDTARAVKEINRKLKSGTDTGRQYGDTP